MRVCIHPINGGKMFRVLKMKEKILMRIVRTQAITEAEHVKQGREKKKNAVIIGSAEEFHDMTHSRIRGLDKESCSIFAWPESKNREYDERRLLLRRQLDDYVKKEWKALEKDFKKSLSSFQANAFNHFQVSSLRVHFGRNAGEIRKLVGFLGKEFSEAISSPVRNMHLFAKIDQFGLSCGLKIPGEAWWDFTALQAAESRQDEIFDFLKEKFSLAEIQAPSWISSEKVNKLDRETWICLLKSLSPGEGFFQISFLNGFDETENFLKMHQKSLVQLFFLLKCTSLN
jgi:hypothetical protein